MGQPVKKRILHFSTYAKIGGTQKMLLEFLRHASHDKYEYYLCVLLGHDALNLEAAKLNIVNASLKMRGYWDVTAWWKLYRFAKGKQFALMQTYGLKADVIGRIVGKVLGIPVNITSVHSTDPWRKWPHVLLDAGTSALTDCYLSNSEAGRLAIHRRERIPLAKIVTILNGINVTEYTPENDLTPGPSPKERGDSLPFGEGWGGVKALRRGAGGGCSNDLRRSLGIAPHDPVIGIVANLCKMKGHTTIVDALPEIQAQFPQVKCLFVGADFLQGEIQRYVREKRQENTVIFTGFRPDIPALLSLLDVFLLPSLWEGLPTALLEALAMQKPVVAAAVDGIPEIVEAGRTGLLIPPQDPQALADAVLFCLSQPERAAQMGQAGAEAVRRKFTLDMVVQQTETLYEQLIRKKCAERNVPGTLEVPGT